MTGLRTAPVAERLQTSHAVATRFFDALNARDYEALDELADPEFVDHDPMPGQAPGIGGLKSSYQVFAGSFPDVRYSVEDVIAENDLVVSRVAIEGTHRAPFMGIPATNKPMRWTATRMFRLRDGLIGETWLNADILGLLVQMGVVPPPG
jgi:steroid delta-isomerase-like uncharacterized protein